MSDPAAGTWEAPGGHLEEGETPRAAALREWQEECGLPVVDGEFVASWTSPDGVYMGFVYEIPREADLDIFARRVGSDPDGDVDGTESIAWWDPQDLPGNPAIRPELAASLDDVLAALGHSPDSGTVSKESVNYRPSQDPARCCGTCSMIRPAPDGYTCTLVQGAIDPGAVCDEWDPAGEGEVAKAADDRGPKGWPGWEHDLTAAAWWATKVTAAAAAALPASKLQQLAREYLASHPAAPETGKRELNDEATAWLRQHAPDLSAALLPLIAGIIADAYAIGAFSAAAVTSGTRADTGTWEEPGDTSGAEERISDLGLGSDYADTTQSQQQDRAGQIAGGFLAAMGRTLADGLQSEADAGSLADSLRQAVDDHPLAAGLVLTVLTAVSALAAGAWYRSAGVRYGTWIGVIDERICPACLQNVASDPVPIGQAYPSGNAFPPVHGRCRCAVVPA